jgi:lipoyl(octanoyl) transferase
MLKVALRSVLLTMPKNMFMPDSKIKQVNYVDLDLCEYKKAWEFQEKKHTEIILRREKDANNNRVGSLIFVEHPHVFTLGKSGKANNLLINETFLQKINASYYQINRGGDITYHGPGQIVGYPIFDLELLKIGVKEYINKIETIIIDTLASFDIVASRLDGATGVWLEAGTPNTRQICAIGVRVSKAVTMHGFALNVNTDLQYFSYINPCGFIDKGVTSMQKELGKKIEMAEVKKKLKFHFNRSFSIEID